MRLSRFFIDQSLRLQQLVTPADAVTHYMRNVLRLKSTDEVLLFNGRESKDYRSVIALSGKKLTLTPLEAIDKQQDSTLEMHMLLALGKPEHIDFALQKATELGVTRITLFNSERTQAPVKGARLEKKMAHWQGVIISACEQCGRNYPAQLTCYRSLAEALKAPAPGNRLILDFDGKPLLQQLEQLDAKAPFHILIGAEGGLSQKEIELAQRHDFRGIYLGPRVLRMETAAMAIASLIQHHFGDLG